MRNTMTYAEWYQTVEKPRLDSLSDFDRRVNSESHTFGRIDDVLRCLNCEIGIWNGWKAACHA